MARLAVKAEAGGAKKAAHVSSGGVRLAPGTFG